MTELLVLHDLNPLRKGFELDPDDLERHSKKIQKRKWRAMFHILENKRPERKKNSCESALYRKRTTTLHKCHWTLHLQRMLDIGFSMNFRCFTSSVLFFLLISLSLTFSILLFLPCVFQNWLNVSMFYSTVCSLNQTFSLSTCHKRAFWVFIISHMSKQCRLSYRFEPTVEVCSPPQCSCREARTSRFWTRSQILFESFTRPFFFNSIF